MDVIGEPAAALNLAHRVVEAVAAGRELPLLAVIEALVCFGASLSAALSLPFLAVDITSSPGSSLPAPLRDMNGAGGCVSSPVRPSP
jgi:hypothetical protein